MSFGLPISRDESQLTYSGYLKVRELTSLQKLLSDPPQHDETLFIIIHQAYELWFKQLLHELDAIIERLNADQPLAAHRLIRRCVEIERLLVNQVAVLETMMPMDFLAFRDHLMPASGFQSAQFRELEFVSGLKDAGYNSSTPIGLVPSARSTCTRIVSISWRPRYLRVQHRRDCFSSRWDSSTRKDTGSATAPSTRTCTHRRPGCRPRAGFKVVSKTRVRTDT